VAREKWDAVVVGAGVTGLFAATELAARGLDVLCLERATVGHAGSGSKGNCRIFRLGYDDPLYVDMARRSLDGWRSLEQRAGEAVIVDCDFLSFGAALPELVEGMAAAGAPAQMLQADEVAGRFPGLAFGTEAVLDPTSGVLCAARALEVVRREAGFELREGLGIRAVDDKSGTALLLDDETGLIEAEVVVVCAGAASAPLLATAGISSRQVATLEQVGYFRLRAGARELPAVAVREGAGQGTELAEQISLYGLPDPVGGCYKLGLHHAGPPVDPAVLPSDDELEPDPELVDRLVAAAAALFPGLDPEPMSFERCVYDSTPDGDFVIDRVGKVVVGAGTSGHGFKFGPVLGRVLADLATDAEPEVAIDRFALRRPALSFE
jgi:sarcosine oxidase